MVLDRPLAGHTTDDDLSQCHTLERGESPARRYTTAATQTMKLKRKEI